MSASQTVSYGLVIIINQNMESFAHGVGSKPPWKASFVSVLECVIATVKLLSFNSKISTISLNISAMGSFDWHAERTDLSGIALLDRAPESEGIDLKQVRLYRQGRLREQMVKYGVDAVILSDPVNIRYATGTRNMQVILQWCFDLT